MHNLVQLGRSQHRMRLMVYNAQGCLIRHSGRTDNFLPLWRLCHREELKALQHPFHFLYSVQKLACAQPAFKDQSLQLCTAPKPCP